MFVYEIFMVVQKVWAFFFVFFFKSSPIHGFYTQEPWFKWFESFTLVVFPQLMSISAAKYFQGIFTGKTFRSAGGHDCIKTQDNRWINNDREKKNRTGLEILIGATKGRKILSKTNLKSLCTRENDRTRTFYLTKWSSPYHRHSTSYCSIGRLTRFFFVLNFNTYFKVLKTSFVLLFHTDPPLLPTFFCCLPTSWTRRLR